VDVWKDSTGGDGDVSKKLVELLVVLNSKSDVSWDDSTLLVISSGVTGKLEDLGTKVLEDGGHVDTGTDSGSLGVSTLLDVSVHSSDWELKSSLGGRTDTLTSTSSTLTLTTSSFTFS